MNTYLGLFYTHKSVSLLMIEKGYSHIMRDHHAGFAAFRKRMQPPNLATDPSNLIKRSISHTFIAEKNKFVAHESLIHVGFNHWNCAEVSKLQ